MTALATAWTTDMPPDLPSNRHGFSMAPVSPRCGRFSRTWLQLGLSIVHPENGVAGVTIGAVMVLAGGIGLVGVGVAVQQATQSAVLVSHTNTLVRAFLAAGIGGGVVFGGLMLLGFLAFSFGAIRLGGLMGRDPCRPS